MNLPNKLTILRILMIPLFLAAIYWQGLPWHFLWALVIFALASFTDLLDGRIARSRDLVTDFGKFMDPLADKVLVMTALVCFVEMGMAPAWVVVLILARELAVTGLRTLAAGAGVVLAADKWGKLKTVSQMTWICYALLTQWLIHDLGVGTPAAGNLFMIYLVGMAVVVVATVGSGVNYLWRNRALFADR